VAADEDLRLELAAVFTAAASVAGRSDGAAVTVVGIFPNDGLADGRVIGPHRGDAHTLAVLIIQALADTAADGSASEHAECGHGQAAVAVAELRAHQA